MFLSTRDIYNIYIYINLSSIVLSLHFAHVLKIQIETKPLTCMMLTHKGISFLYHFKSNLITFLQLTNTLKVAPLTLFKFLLGSYLFCYQFILYSFFNFNYMMKVSVKSNYNKLVINFYEKKTFYAKIRAFIDMFDRELEDSND